MEVRNLSFSIVRPSMQVDEPTKIPLTIFDRIMINIYVPILMAFKAPTPSNQAIKDSLSILLVHYPHLSGKIRNDPKSPHVLIDNDAGVPVLEAEVDSDLADLLPLEPAWELDPLYPTYENIDRTLTVKINRFRCGGVAVGVVNNHRVCDGQSMSQFFINWGRVIRGLELDPVPKYGPQMLPPRSPPRVDFEHEIEFAQPNEIPRIVDEDTITNVMVHYSDEFVRKLKDKAGKIGGVRSYSRFQCLAAHLWSKVCEARGLDDHQPTMLMVPVNGRPKLMLGDEYFGNVILCAHSTSTSRELHQGGLSYAAKLIHEAVSFTNKDYFQSFVDFGAVHEGEELVPSCFSDNSYSPDLEVDSWLGFEFSKMDFGGGELVGFIGHVEPIEGLVTLMPSTNRKGGVEVHISLLKEHVDAFKRIAYEID